MAAPAWVRRFGVFNLVGFSGFLLQLALLSVLTRGFAWHDTVATAVAIEAALLHNFVGHTRWTWRDRRLGQMPLGRRLARYQAAKTVTLAANLALTAWLVRATPLPLELANIAAVIAMSSVNYAISDRWLFQRGRESFSFCTPVVHSRATLVGLLSKSTRKTTPDPLLGSEHREGAGGTIEAPALRRRKRPIGC